MPPEYDESRAYEEDWAGDEDWPGDVVWPAEDDGGVPWAGAAGPDLPWAGARVPPVAGGVPPAPPGPPRRHEPRFGRVATMVAVIVVAGAVGVGLTLALTRAPATPAAAASSPSTPGGGVPEPRSPGANGPVRGPLGPGNEVSEISMLGTVTAVSPASITIGGNGLSVTATVTSATKVSGRVTSIGQIKVGDQVSAQMTQSGSKVTVVAIEYPAGQSGPGQSLPG